MEAQNLIQSTARGRRAYWAFIANESIFLILNSKKKEDMKNNDPKKR
jgi:hypothetical protein